MKQFKLLSSIILFILLIITPLKSEIIKKIEILGNERVADETILMFANVKIDDDLKENEINKTTVQTIS